MGIIKVLALALIDVEYALIDVEYERLINHYSSFGSDFVASVGESNIYPKFMFTPFYRMYFTKSQEYGIKGFFVQGFSNYNYGKSQSFDQSNNVNGEYHFFGLGFGLGQKWVNKKGFVFQILLGAEKKLSGTGSSPNFLIIGDFYVGYRF